MTFMGAMECIFADEKPTDYDLGATKGWLPKSKELMIGLAIRQAWLR